MVEMTAVDEHRGYAPKRLRFAIFTASGSRTEAADQSGQVLVDLVTAARHPVVERRVVPDDVVAIRTAVEAVLNGPRADVVVVNGGTGFSPRDVTLEAVTPLLQRAIEGFGELFRMLSFEQVGAAAMLSRATAGVVDQSVVFVLPGSPQAVELAMRELILPEVGHLLGQVRRER